MSAPDFLLLRPAFTDHPPADGATYAYWVRAVDPAGHESSDSAAVYVSTADATAPEAPTSLTAQGTTAGNTLRWTAPPGDWDHFEISSDPDARPYPDEGATTTSFTAHTDLSATGVFRASPSRTASEPSTPRGTPPRTPKP
ncbi:hypothetical protein [Streptomyces sp. NBC_00063]|uniref:hypothetical protein n=1 Tax=Streptomyces sp. NBC_00063 TaxID=2975638 RepID=UPI003D741FF4